MKPEIPNKILLVDDTLSIIDLLKDLLLSKGFQVYIATSGEKALQISEHILPDLILLDILMPGIDGYQTCIQLKSRDSLKNVPIIIMSALHESFDKVKAFNAGASDYICKPIETEELFARINTHLKLYSAQKQLIEANSLLEKRVEERTRELLNAKEKAEESDRLKSAFLANISHEIRTPLNGILGFSELIASNDIPGDKRAEYVQTIAECSEKLLKTVSDILDLSKLQAHIHKIEKRPVHIHDLLDKVIASFLSQAAQKQLKLHIDLNNHPARLVAFTDEAKLKQALSILVENAIKFTETGSIRVGYYLKDNGLLEFYVEDTGVGIADNLINKMFEHFRQADDDFSRLYGGIGVGLAICKGLVELLGGNIKAESKIGVGTTFYFTIKFEEVPEITPINSKVKTSVSADKMLNILVAEDEIANFLYINELLSISDRIKIYHADNGIKAVELSKLHDIDLVLMDIKMPDMDGLEAMKQIKKMKPALPIIALTAYASEEDRYKFLHAGFDNYFSKPVKSSDLLAFINTYHI